MKLSRTSCLIILLTCGGAYYQVSYAQLRLETKTRLDAELNQKSLERENLTAYYNPLQLKESAVFKNLNSNKTAITPLNSELIKKEQTIRRIDHKLEGNFSKPVLRENSTIDTAINLIQEYYYTRNLKEASRHDYIRNDSTVEIIFYSPDVDFDLTNGEFLHVTLHYGASASHSDFLVGDLDHNETQDYLITVKETAIGGSPTLSINRYFAIINGKRQNAEIAAVFSDSDFSQDCLFMPIAIRDERIIGKSFCYRSTDPLCCPSLQKTVHLKLEGRKIIVVSKK